MKIVKKTCLAQQMAEKIAVEVDAEICFGKNCKNQQKSVCECKNFCAGQTHGTKHLRSCTTS